MKDFPNDDDGDVLRGLLAKGVDLTLPRKIEFYCYAENEGFALNIAKQLDSLGYKSEVFDDDEAPSEDRRFSVYSTLDMVPSYEEVVKTQRKLNSILSNFNTRCDGWGTLVDPEFNP